MIIFYNNIVRNLQQKFYGCCFSIVISLKTTMSTKFSVESITRQIKDKKDIDKIAGQVIKNPVLIKELVEQLTTEKSSLKFGYEKILRLISEKSPELIYPYFDDFVKLLDSENNFLKWGTIITIANLTAVDSKNKFDKIFKRYYSPVSGPDLIPAGNTIGNSWKIALAKPHLTEKIAKEILKVQNAKFIHHGKFSPECKNVASGHAIDSICMFFDKIKNKKPVIEFVKNQLNNGRMAVRKKAEKFLKKFIVET